MLTFPLRVALIGSARYAFREPYVGGVAAHVVGLARGLAERGHDVTLFAPEGSDAGGGVRTVPFCAASGLDYSAAARGDVSMLAEPFMREHHAALALMLGLQRGTWGRFDVVHNHSLHHLPIGMAPAVDAAHLTTLHSPPTPWQESAFACLPERDRPAAVTVSATNRALWRPSLPSCGVVPNGVDLGRWTFSDRPAPDLAVWAGRLVPEKGPHLAIDAARAAGLRLRLVGPAYDASYYDAEIAPRLGADVDVVGHASHADLARHYGAAAVALSTARWEEPYGLTLVEALACGTPVAAFRRGAAPELLTRATGRLAAPDDAADLARAAREAAALDRRACRAWAEAHASERAMIDRYLALYRRLVAAREPAPPRPLPVRLVAASGGAASGGVEVAEAVGAEA
ncbi:glycosyltransferase [Rubrivirga sp. S365]|uniref:Glycosyltransferase n=1 Tax=Rubrivirga litoralis TaxID=3075598 RepID=A0ABU3BQD9_9BACT|nr:MULTISPECIES: glycosyltransferase [unclassified Rubrivirga]MDT0631500.1 glycosyltransferase [Rubrivirga sp. F394]MDT7855517.1 glycosyltransferase [Rubrivirga sp. S365]